MHIDEELDTLYQEWVREQQDRVRREQAREQVRDKRESLLWIGILLIVVAMLLGLALVESVDAQEALDMPYVASNSLPDAPIANMGHEAEFSVVRDKGCVLEAPIAKPILREPKFWAGVAIIGAAIALDQASTSYAMGQNGRELNPVLGKHPSNGKLVGFGILDLSVSTTAHWLLWRHARHAGHERQQVDEWMMPAVDAGWRGGLAVHNWRQPWHSTAPLAKVLP